jgi:hypothetical protein
MCPERSDDHWPDCLVGCAVAASMQGVVLPGTEVKPTAIGTWRIPGGGDFPDQQRGLASAFDWPDSGA